MEVVAPSRRVIIRRTVTRKIPAWALVFLFSGVLGILKTEIQEFRKRPLTQLPRNLRNRFGGHPLIFSEAQWIQPGQLAYTKLFNQVHINQEPPASANRLARRPQQVGRPGVP